MLQTQISLYFVSFPTRDQRWSPNLYLEDCAYFIHLFSIFRITNDDICLPEMLFLFCSKVIGIFKFKRWNIRGLLGWDWALLPAGGSFKVRGGAFSASLGPTADLSVTFTTQKIFLFKMLCNSLRVCTLATLWPVCGPQQPGHSILRDWLSRVLEVVGFTVTTRQWWGVSDTNRDTTEWHNAEKWVASTRKFSQTSIFKM